MKKDGIAIIKYNHPDKDGKMLKGLEWSIGCLLDADNKETIKAHLTKHIPKAEFVSVEFIEVKRRKMDKDITDKVTFGNNDDELLPLTKCVCGLEFGSWEFLLSIYKEDSCVCDNCGRKMYFKNEIRVYEVRDE